MRYLLIFIGCFLLFSVKTYAYDETAEKEILDHYYDIEEIDFNVSKLMGDDSVSLKDVVIKLLSGDLSGVAKLVKKATIDKIRQETKGYVQLFSLILLLGILAAFISQFTEFFHTHQVSSVSFYFIYLMLSSLLLQIFYYGVDIAEEVIGTIVDLVRLLVPTYIMTVGIASGELTAMAFYKIVLGIIFLVEYGISSLLLPFLYSYTILVLMNGLMEQEKLVHVIDLMKKVIESAVKASIMLVTGFSILQAMLAPVIDNVKVNTVQKILASMPGIGNIAELTTQTVYGSLVIVKNSVGVAFVVFLLWIALIPLIKLLLLATVVKLAGAIVSIVTDRRFSGCVDRIGDAFLLLFKITLASTVLFMISISVVAFTTNRGL